MNPDTLRQWAKDAGWLDKAEISNAMFAAADTWEAAEKRLKDVEEAWENDPRPGMLGTALEKAEKRLEEAEKPIDTSTWFYKNCKRQRKNAAKICQVCPFRLSIEAQEAALAKEETITDGYSTWPRRCAMCGQDTMQVVRPGKVQCSKCG